MDRSARQVGNLTCLGEVTGIPPATPRSPSPRKALKLNPTKYIITLGPRSVNSVTRLHASCLYPVALWEWVGDKARYLAKAQYNWRSAVAEVVTLVESQSGRYLPGDFSQQTEIHLSSEHLIILHTGTAHLFLDGDNLPKGGDDVS